MTAFIAKRYNVVVAREDSFGLFNPEASAYQQIRPESKAFEHQGKTEMLERSYIRADLSNSPSIAGASSCSVKLQLPARGGGNVAGVDQSSAPNDELATLLDSCIGNKVFDTGVQIVSGNLGILKINGTPSEKFSMGSLIFVDPDGSGDVEACWISGFDDSTNDLFIAGLWEGGELWQLSKSPTSSGVIYACSQYTPTPTGHSSLCMELGGVTINSQQPVWRYLGLVGNMQIVDSNSQKRVMLQFDYKGDNYELAHGNTLIDFATTNQWPTAPNDLRSLSADFRISGQKVAYHNFSLDLGNNWAEAFNANASNGRDNFVLTGIATKGKCTVYWDDNLEQLKNQSEHIDISWVIGSHKNAIAFHAPNCEIRELKEAEINGLLAMEIEFVVLPCITDAIPDWTLSFAGKI